MRRKCQHAVFPLRFAVHRDPLAARADIHFSRNFLHPHFLAPPMPWPAWRHMPEADLWAIAAYLHRALKPVVNKVEDSEGPPDFWASAYTDDKIGTYPAPAFPAATERLPK